MFQSSVKFLLGTSVFCAGISAFAADREPGPFDTESPTLLNLHVGDRFEGQDEISKKSCSVVVIKVIGDQYQLSTRIGSSVLPRVTYHKVMALGTRYSGELGRQPAPIGANPETNLVKIALLSHSYFLEEYRFRVFNETPDEPASVDQTIIDCRNLEFKIR